VVEVADDRGYCGVASFFLSLWYVVQCALINYMVFRPSFPYKLGQYGRRPFLLINDYNNSPAIIKKVKKILKIYSILDFF
jgi:hypothetical protein